MNKFLKNIFLLACFCCLSFNVLGKAIPPGTGSADIKNNILFILDYSNDMKKCAGVACADNRPNDIAVGTNGDIYVVGGHGGNLFRYNSEGVYQNMLKVKTNTSRMFGCGMNPADSTDKFIYCADWAAWWIAKICTGQVLDDECETAGFVVKKKQTSSPLDIAIHSSGDWAMVTDCGATQKYNLTNFSTTGDVANFWCPDFVAFDSSGSFYVTQWWGNTLEKYSGTGPFTTNWSSWVCPNSEMVAPSGDHVFTTARGRGKICKLRASNGQLVDENNNLISWGNFKNKSLFGRGEGGGHFKFKNAWGGATDPSTGNIVIADTDNRRVQVMDTSGNHVKDFKTGEPTKLQTALNAIITVMNDSEINETANFGLEFFNKTDKPTIFAPLNEQGKSTISQYMVANLKNPKGKLSSKVGCGRAKAYWMGDWEWKVFNKNFTNNNNKYPNIDLPSPVLANATACSNNFNIILLGTATGNEVSVAKGPIADMLNGPHNVKTFVVYLGSSSGVSAQLHDLAEAGGTGPAEDPPNSKKPGVLFAADPDALTQKLRTAIRSAVTSTFTFASPSIDLDYSQGAEETYVLQATFEYIEGAPWIGQLAKYEIKNGLVQSPPAWKAHDKLNNQHPKDRHIFTVVPGGLMEVPVEEIDKNNLYSDGTPHYLNNFHPSKSSLLMDHMNDSGLLNENDVINLINYNRGYDSYDEDQNCTGTFSESGPEQNSPLQTNIEDPATNNCVAQSRGTFVNSTTNKNTYKLFDIYHSKPVIVTPPSDPAFAFAENSETKYRFLNGYNAFRESHKNREKIVLVGSNNGMIHAFNYSDGVEEWAFIPPSLLNKFEGTLSPRKTTNLNETADMSVPMISATKSDNGGALIFADVTQFPPKGVVKIDDELIYYGSKISDTTLGDIKRAYFGTEATSHKIQAAAELVSEKQKIASSMYGVDATAVIKDIHTQDPGCDIKTWKTVAIIPMGRGGNAYTALDITDVKKPYHLFTIENDTSGALKKINYWYTDYTRVSCNITATKTNLTSITYEPPYVTPKATLTSAITAEATTIPVNDASGYRTTKCPAKCVIRIGEEIMSYESISDNSFINVTRSQAQDDDNPLSTNQSHALDSVVYQDAICGSENTETFNVAKKTKKFDYTAIAQAWGTPDINLLTLEDGSKRWVMIIGAGYNGATDCNNGSAIYLIHLENFDTTNDTYTAGTIAKKITIPGSDLDIPNSIPGDLTIITNDSGIGLNMEDGALIYFVDINNRVWKVNLLKSSVTNNTFGEKKLLYSDQATFTKDNRNFQRVLASIDESTLFDGIARDGLLRLFYGTGNAQNLGVANTDIQNAIYGLSDPEFPYYGIMGDSLLSNDITITEPAYQISQCFTGNDPLYTGGTAPQYNCPPLTTNTPGWKIDLEQGERIVGKKPLLTGGYLYFSVYDPNILNACLPGDASLGVYDYMCPAGSSVQINLGKGLLTSAESDGEFIYFGQSNVADDGTSGTVKTGTAMGEMAADGNMEAEELAQSVTNIDEGDTGSLKQMGVAGESESESMGRSWRELR